VPSALRSQTEKGCVQMLQLDLRARRGFDSHGIGAPFALRVFTEQGELGGTGVVEFRLVESGDLELPAIATPLFLTPAPRFPAGVPRSLFSWWALKNPPALLTVRANPRMIDN
jgi:hypothetical protein